MKRYFIYIFLLLAVLAGSLASCEKEESYSAELAQLQFSSDTMAFDTVFTQMGTTTRQLLVYNRGDEAVRFDAVTLEGGRASRFRLNVDGDTNMVARNIEIAAGDSIFIFVRANIRPNEATEPFLIEDAILFGLGGHERRLPLTAYGRNAVYHTPTDTLHDLEGNVLRDMFGQPYAYSVIDCEGWRHDLPHVVLGYAVVDSRNTLSLVAGDELYFHNNAVLWIYDSASLDVHGSEERPVLFTSVRHDGWYDYLPGQWGYIWLMQGSVDNTIDWAVIENGYIGLRIDSCANTHPTLTISNSVVRNESSVGLFCQTAHVVGDNLLVSNCGEATAVEQYGGRYEFSRCTFADYWRYSARKTPSFYVTNTRDYEGVHYVWPMRSKLTDCIIYGSNSDGEIYIGLDAAATAVLDIQHSLIRGGEWDEDPRFEDPYEGDYHLKEDSPALGIGYQFPAQDTTTSGDTKYRFTKKSSHRLTNAR